MNLRNLLVNIIARHFTKILLLTLLIISCPRPELQVITTPDYLHEARRLAAENPLAACLLLQETEIDEDFKLERANILVQIYLNQREFQKAALLLDSINWRVDIKPYDRHIIMIRAGRYAELAEKSGDSLLKGIANLRSGNFAEAINLLSMPTMLDEYRRINLAKAYEGLNDHITAFSILAAIDSVPNYLLS